MEIINPSAPRGAFRFALFDFDGTLSLIREGWQNVMLPFFVEELLGTPNHEPQEQIEAVVREFVEKLTGKQTIYQCFQLQEEIKKRGGMPREALDYKREYLRRLDERIAHRIEGLNSGTISPEDLLLRGSRVLLQDLQTRGVASYLASGTDIAYVQSEADALQVSHFFGPHLYAALDRHQDFSKQMVIERILKENDLQGPELLVIGDGYVEIENGKSAGGFAVGVASDEANPGGLDEWKRRRLIAAGADIIIPDYANLDELMGYLMTRNP